MTREMFIADIAGRVTDYRPNEAVLAGLAAIDLTTVSGPICMGKDSVINATGLNRVIADTIREPRLNEGVPETDGHPYWFKAAELDEVRDDLDTGNYVQINMGPGNDSFYGSRADAYPTAGPVLLDLKTAQADYMRQLPFSVVRTTMVTARDFETWQKHLTKRGVSDQQYLRMRIADAEAALRLALEDEQFIFILNDELEAAAAVLKTVAETGEYDRKVMVKAKNCAAGILKRLAD